MLKHIIDRCQRRFRDDDSSDEGPEVEETYNWSVTRIQLFHKLGVNMLPAGYTDSD